MENEVILNEKASRKDKFKFVNADKTLHDTKFETKPVSYFQDCLRRFVKNKASVVGGIIILIIILFAIFEPICDPKNYVDSSMYPNGFQDKNFQTVLPRNDWFLGTGFWDGTEERTIGETDYNINRFTDSNHERIELLEVIDNSIQIGSTVIRSVNYRVRWDTYAIGNKVLKISKAEYEKLVEYEKENSIYQTENSILKPLVNYSESTDGYLKELRQQLLDEGVASSSVNSIITNLNTFYSQNTDVYYKLVPTQKNDGSYSDTQFTPVIETVNGVEQPVSIYYTDDNNQNVYYQIQNAEYVVRVDYFDYFTYVHGFKPVFLFGANQFGQDICLRLAMGARFSLLLGVGITIINFIIGLIWGAISGYYGGRVDLIMERFTDIIANVPTIIIMTIAQIQLTNNIELKKAIGAVGTVVLAILIAFVYNGWVGVSSTTRMQFYRFKGQEYVLASRTLGARDRRLIFKHILPNAAGTLVTSSVLMIPGVIFSESSLSYLGIIDFTSSGISSIGALLSEGQQAGLATNPHVLLFPALIISLLMISFNLFGNGLRDAFNTTLRGSED